MVTIGNIMGCVILAAVIVVCAFVLWACAKVGADYDKRVGIK